MGLFGRSTAEIDKLFFEQFQNHVSVYVYYAIVGNYLLKHPEERERGNQALGLDVKVASEFMFSVTKIYAKAYSKSIGDNDWEGGLAGLVAQSKSEYASMFRPDAENREEGEYFFLQDFPIMARTHVLTYQEKINNHRYKYDFQAIQEELYKGDIRKCKKLMTRFFVQVNQPIDNWEASIEFLCDCFYSWGANGDFIPGSAKEQHESEKGSKHDSAQIDELLNQELPPVLIDIERLLTSLYIDSKYIDMNTVAKATHLVTVQYDLLAKHYEIIPYSLPEHLPMIYMRHIGVFTSSPEDFTRQYTKYKAWYVEAISSTNMEKIMEYQVQFDNDFVKVVDQVVKDWGTPEEAFKKSKTAQNLFDDKVGMNGVYKYALEIEKELGLSRSEPEDISKTESFSKEETSNIKKEKPSEEENEGGARFI